MRMHMGHLALRTPDPDRYATDIVSLLGLEERERTHDEIMLASANYRHHELQLTRGVQAGVDHIGLELETTDDLEELAQRLDRAGATIVSREPQESGMQAAIRFVGPVGFLYEAYVGDTPHTPTLPEFLRGGVRRYGHLTIFSTQHAEILSFWLDVLGFQVSDTFEGITWTRCDANHHGLAIGAAPDGAPTILHHYAWEVQDVSELTRHLDRQALVGRQAMWGPVRHGVGFNLSTYWSDAHGCAVELTTDLLRIDADRNYVPIDWSNEPRAINLWGPPATEAFFTSGIPILDASTSLPV